MTKPAYAACMDWPLKVPGLAGCEHWKFSHCEKFPHGIPRAYLERRQRCPFGKPIPESEWIARIEAILGKAERR